MFYLFQLMSLREPKRQCREITNHVSRSFSAQSLLPEVDKGLLSFSIIINVQCELFHEIKILILVPITRKLSHFKRPNSLVLKDEFTQN